MNHPGEIAALTRLVRPHIAVVTTVEPAHLGFFPSVEAIADAKAEIFLGLEPGGTAILNRDNPHFARLASAAERAGAAEVIGFGSHPEAQARLLDCVLGPERSAVEALISGSVVRFRLPVPGRHWVMNALGSARRGGRRGRRCRTSSRGASRARAAAGARPALPSSPGAADHLTLIDESYNASPAAMRAALAVLGNTEPGPGARRVAVLGDMLELGDSADRAACRARRAARRRRNRPRLPRRRGDGGTFRGPSRRQTRRVVALCRQGYPCVNRLPRTRRCRDGQRLARCPPRRHRGAAVRGVRPAKDITRCCTPFSTRWRISFSSSTCSATSPSAREGRSSPRY